MRYWDKYLNSQKYSECQLVTAINAAYYLRNETVNPTSKRYEKLVDLVGARHGAALRDLLPKAHKRLGVKPGRSYSSFFWLKKDLRDRGKLEAPTEIAVRSKNYGTHSVLIVDYEPKTDAVRIANFGLHTSISGWIFIEDLDLYVIDNQITSQSTKKDYIRTFVKDEKRRHIRKRCRKT